MNDVKVIDNTEKVNGKLLEALLKGLEKCGMKGESYAKAACPTDTGALRNSITHEVIADDHSVIIGTNMEYAVYVELGTGIYASTGGGRTDPWSFQDSKGEWHKTNGQRPQPYLKPVAEQHGDEFRKILESAIKNG